jgi:predicted transcriptional regulator
MSRLESVDPNTDLLDALQKMEEANLSELPVVQQNQPVGMLIRENVLRYLRLRTQLGV